MQVSDTFFDYLSKWEGLKLCPYKDVTGKPTIGFGSTFYENGTPVKMTDVCITFGRAVQLAQRVLVYFEEGVSKFAPHINQNQFDALVDISYNEGLIAIGNSHLVQKVRANPEDPTIRDEFMRWVYVKNAVTGKEEVSPWQVKRRTADADLYFKAIQ